MLLITAQISSSVCAIAASSTAPIAVLGACEDNSHANASYAGAAFIVDLESGQPLAPKVYADSPNDGARFGVALAISSGSGSSVSGNLLLIGADRAMTRVYHATGGHTRKSTGAVYVYYLGGSTATGYTADAPPALAYVLTPSDADDDAHFGCAIATHGSRAIIGARGPDSYSAGRMTVDGNGAAYIYDLTTGTRITRLAPSDPSTGMAYTGCFWCALVLASCYSYPRATLVPHCALCCTVPCSFPLAMRCSPRCHVLCIYVLVTLYAHLCCLPPWLARPLPQVWCGGGALGWYRRRRRATRPLPLRLRRPRRLGLHLR